MEPKLEITNLLKPLIDTIKALNDERKHLLDIGIGEYLEGQTEKYYYTNTFIHRSEKVKFYDIYYPLKAAYKNLKTDFINLNYLFDNYKNITLIGSAGSGKTTLMKYIFLQTIKTSQKIPLLIELRHFNDFGGDLEGLISEKVLKLKLKPNSSTFTRTLEKGSFLFLFDGYDEIVSNKKSEINRQLELFVDSYPKNNFLITTRPGSGIECFPRFFDFKVCSLEDEEVEGFISKIVEEIERRDRIIAVTKDVENQNYMEYLRNPLLLSMFILAFESHPEIPAKKSSFYQNVFDTLYSKHDGITKHSFPRERLTKLQKEEFEQILNTFSFLSLMEGKISFTHEYLFESFRKIKEGIELMFRPEDLIVDFHTSISILILDGLIYTFPHRSLQEYFAVQFISKLPSEKKERAYEKVKVFFHRLSFDSGKHFFKLCEELDKKKFTQFFLLPNLKHALEFLKENTGEKELIKKWFRLNEPDFVLDMGGLFMYKTNQSIFYSIFEFCGICDFQKIHLFPKEAMIENQLIKFFDNRPFIRSIENTKFISLFKDNGFTEIILEHIEEISRKIKYLEEEIERKENNFDNLLDL